MKEVMLPTPTSYYACGSLGRWNRQPLFTTSTNDPFVYLQLQDNLLHQASLQQQMSQATYGFARYYGTKRVNGLAARFEP